MSDKSKKLDTCVVKKSNNVIVRLLDADITYVEAGWCQFKIEIIERILSDTGDSCNGQVDFDEYCLRLDPKMDAELALETLLHELIHIVTMNVGYGEDFEGHFSNEDLTVQISRGLLQLYRLNPKLMMILSDLACKETPFK